MTHPDRWQHAERLFHAALARDESERAAFLREACRGDERLRRDVESLLAFESDAQAFLQAPVLEIAPALIQAEAATPFAGQRLGPYAIGTLLGSGGMGDVYRARDTVLGREVAIKILPEVFIADRDRRARFEREARLLAALNHPHIGAIYGFEQREGLYGLVLELVEGQTLAARLSAGPLPVREALTIARQIADALDAAHEKGIVHRDLKPSNIMITPEGVVKVLDFGLAKADLEDPTAVTDDTRDGLILGTAAYMSPEQARGKRVDKRTDIWAFGCVVWAMLTARAPFAGDTVSDKLPPFSSCSRLGTPLPPEPPARIRRLLQRYLEKDPKRRLRDTGDALLDGDEQTDAAPVRGGVEAADRVPSLAVLPFADMSAQKDQDYFCEGMAEELITAFSKLPGLRVVSRTSSFRFKRAEDINKIGNDLGVGAVLEGSVRTAGKRLRVAVQLINVEDGYHLWSERLAWLSNALLCQAHYARREYADGVKQARTTLELAPSHHWYPEAFAGLCLTALGHLPDAIDACERAAHGSGRLSLTLGYLGFALAKTGRRKDAELILRELQDRSGGDGDMPHAFACVYAGLNQHDEAFSSLDHAVALRDPQLAFHLSYPILDGLRTDPRFASVVQRVRRQDRGANS